MTVARVPPVGTAKGYTAGTHRAVPPDQTLERVRPLLAPLGITRLADLTGLDRIGIPVMAAYRPDAWSLAVSMGKGASPAAAAASAAMESIELWHAERPDLSLHWGAAAELGCRHRLVDWAALPPAADTAGLDDRTATAWVEATSLLDGDPSLVPYEAVHTDGRDPEPPGSGWFACTSNGLASGNTTVEAQVHALCEVIERDAVTLWRLAGRPAAGLLDPSTVTEPACADLLGRFAAAGVAVLLHDITSDLGVPAVHCLVFEPGVGPAALVHAATGMGCHPSPAVALSRAITEAAQSRLTLISGARDDLERARYAPPADAADQLARLAGLQAEAARAGSSFGDLPDRSGRTLEDDLATVLEALAAKGLDPHWVDLGRPEIGVAVGRAVVAGLEPLSDLPGYRPGRRARAVLAGGRP